MSRKPKHAELSDLNTIDVHQGIADWLAEGEVELEEEGEDD